MINREEICAFLGINYIMSISNLLNLRCYWSDDSHFSNDDVRNAITRDHFVKIVQNIHFADNQAVAKSDKA